MRCGKLAGAEYYRYPTFNLGAGARKTSWRNAACMPAWGCGFWRQQSLCVVRYHTMSSNSILRVARAHGRGFSTPCSDMSLGVACSRRSDVRFGNFHGVSPKSIAAHRRTHSLPLPRGSRRRAAAVAAAATANRESCVQSSSSRTPPPFSPNRDCCTVSALPALTCQTRPGWMRRSHLCRRSPRAC